MSRRFRAPDLCAKSRYSPSLHSFPLWIAAACFAVRPPRANTCYTSGYHRTAYLLPGARQRKRSRYIMIKFSSIGLTVIAFAGTGILSACKVRPSRAERREPTATRTLPTTPRPARQFSYSTIAFIPTARGLQQRGVSPTVQAAQRRAHGNRKPLLNEVIRLAPNFYPPQARVLEVKRGGLRGTYFVIDLNRAFFNEKYWSGRSRKDTNLAVHALARNVAFMNAGKGIPLPVKFVVEGKQVASIGSFAADRLVMVKEIMRPRDKVGPAVHSPSVK